MYTLYFSPGSCSMAVRTILNELNVPFEAKPASANGVKSPEFLKINPRGMVPTIVDDGFAIREGGAIITYLCDKHKSPLMPASGKERAAALEWLMFCNSSLHPVYGKVFSLGRTSLDDKAKEQVRSAACEQIQNYWNDIENHLKQSGNEYLAGKNITAGDILLAVIANWTKNMGQPIYIGARTRKLLEAVTARPAFQKSLKDESVEYVIPETKAA